MLQLSVCEHRLVPFFQQSKFDLTFLCAGREIQKNPITSNSPTLLPVRLFNLFFTICPDSHPVNCIIEHVSESEGVIYIDRVHSVIKCDTIL
jgi:hypothetical protein